MITFDGVIWNSDIGSTIEIEYFGVISDVPYKIGYQTVRGALTDIKPAGLGYSSLFIDSVQWGVFSPMSDGEVRVLG
jgi:hypothetical protein